jgi:multidrug resistance protein, MATE family
LASESVTAAAGAERRPHRSTVPESSAEVGRAVNRLAWPVIVENLFQTALGTVDMIMVGSLGAVAIAGVGTAMQIVFVLQAAFSAITTGTTVLVARLIGAHQDADANAVVKQSLLLGAAVATVFAVLGLLFSHAAIAVMGAEPDVVRDGAVYLRIVTVSSLLMVYMFVISGALRGAGDTRTPMVITGAINAVNVVAAYALIFGKFGMPALGVAGAALGATIARLVGTVLLLGFLLRGKGVLTIRGRAGWRPSPPIIGRLLRLGVPSMLEQFAMSGGMLLYGIIAISLGTVVYATQRVTFQALSLSFMPGFGFAMAATAMVGQCLGAQRPDLSERSGWYATRMAVIWMTLMGLGMALFGRPIMRLFTSEPEMIAMGTDALKVIALSQPFMAVAMVVAGSLRGAGDTRFPMWATFVSIWLVRLPLGYLFGPYLGWGLSGLYISNVLDGVARAVANFVRYRRGSWRTIEV